MVLRLVPFCMLLIAARCVWGQPVSGNTNAGYPNKPVRILTSEIGGGNDIASRLIAPSLAAALGQQVVVENRAGIIAIEAASKAQPDGYTLLLNGSIIWIEPMLRANVPWHALKSFAPIALVATSTNVLVVHPSIAATSVKELIALAKARPGELNYASGASGTAAHIAAELFKFMAGVNLVRVPYRGSGPAVVDLLAGRVQLMFATTASVTSAIKSGKLRALAVTSAQPSALAPGLPTVAETGLPGYQSNIRHVTLAPAATPAAAIKRLNSEIVQALSRNDMKERFFNTGLETAGGTPEQLAATMKSEITLLSKLVKDVGIRAD